MSWKVCCDVYGAFGKLPNGPGPRRSGEAPRMWSYAIRCSNPAASASVAHRRMASGSMPLSACEKMAPTLITSLFYPAGVPRPLLVGIQTPEVEWEVPFPELIRMAQTAEAVGFDSVWLGDHLLYDLPVGPRGPWEVWTSLAALAASTERVLLGPLVASAGFHEPTMLAKQAATVDAISAGRLILGLGSGWNEREYRAFGFPFDHRVSRFAEAFTIIRMLLGDGSIDFAGEFYRVENCVLHPPPVRPGGPLLMVGSVRPRMMSITLPHVDAWNVWWSDYGNTPAGFADIKSTVD